MIIRRKLYPQDKLAKQQVHDNGMEVKPIYKKLPSASCIRQDVEDLLKPIKRPTYNEETDIYHNYLSKERTERNLWRIEEVMEMLYTMQEVKALERLNDKTVKSELVFKSVEAIMHRNGFVKKSHLQIWTKWKFLKSTYMTSKRNGVIPRIVPPKVYDMIHKMVTGLNQSMADSSSSVDGDSSSGMLISGVEGGISDVGVANEKDDDSFGMAHPIFGFRLGMVKSEPEDTGYEPVDSNDSDKDPLNEEQSSPSKSVKDYKEEHNKNEIKSNKNQPPPPPPPQKVAEVPHRGRGRPPKNPPTAASTPYNEPYPAAMPPLRVAPFAKSNHTPESIAVSRSPPPLTMPPIPRIRVTNLANLKSGDTPKFAQPKLIPKPTPQQHSLPAKSARLTKEIAAQGRSSSSPSPSYPKMKQIPMRKTPYSLRPDRAIPDLESSLSPPPSPINEKPSNRKMVAEVPINKHSTMQSFQTTGNRKRRIDWQDAVPSSKQAKCNNILDEDRNDSKSSNIEYDKNYGKVLQNVIIDLSSSLRKMQTEMMRDFFNKQNELLEREHKFQMQQDRMIMKAFEEQTQEIMQSVKQLVGNIKTYKNDRQQQKQTKKNIKETKSNRIRRRMQEIHIKEQEDDVDEHQIQNNEENGIEDEEEGQEHEQDEMEQETVDLYVEDEQQDETDDHDDNEQDDTEDNANQEENEENDEHEDQDQTLLMEEPNENGLVYDEHDNSNNSIEDKQRPIHTTSNELSKD